MSTGVIVQEWFVYAFWQTSSVVLYPYFSSSLFSGEILWCGRREVGAGETFTALAVNTETAICVGCMLIFKSAHPKKRCCSFSHKRMRKTWAELILTLQQVHSWFLILTSCTLVYYFSFTQRSFTPCAGLPLVLCQVWMVKRCLKKVLLKNPALCCWIPLPKVC